MGIGMPKKMRWELGGAKTTESDVTILNNKVQQSVNVPGANHSKRVANCTTTMCRKGYHKVYERPPDAKTRKKR